MAAHIHPLLALAGLAGFSSEDSLLMDVMILIVGGLHALFLPIFTSDHAPRWMVLLQPVLLISGLAVVKLRVCPGIKLKVNRAFTYLAAYCVIMFATNMAGEARGLFSTAESVIDTATVLMEGKGAPTDTRP